MVDSLSNEGKVPAKRGKVLVNEGKFLLNEGGVSLLNYMGNLSLLGEELVLEQRENYC
jgi:hypothetical protein